MRVLICMASWTRGASGGDMHILTSARRWSDRVDVRVVCPRGAVPLVRDFLPHAPVSTFRAWAPTNSAPLMAAEYVRRLLPAARAARRAGPVDIAIAASHFIPDAAAITSARARRRVAFVYHLSKLQGRDPGLRTALALAGEDLGVAWLRRVVDLAFVSNDLTITRPDQWRGVERTDVGIVMPIARPARPAVPEYAAAFVGRLVPTKGIRDLVRAFAQVRSARPGARLAVVGTGADADAARALAASLGVADAIDWLGFVDEQEKRRVLAASESLLFPSYEEGWGIAICEALALGTPVVAYDLPLYGGIFPEGLVTVPRGDWSSLAQACVSLLGDPDRATALGESGRQWVQRYDVQDIADRELLALARAIGRDGSGGDHVPR